MLNTFTKNDEHFHVWKSMTIIVWSYVNSEFCCCFSVAVVKIFFSFSLSPYDICFHSMNILFLFISHLHWIILSIGAYPLTETAIREFWFFLSKTDSSISWKKCQRNILDKLKLPFPSHSNYYIAFERVFILKCKKAWYLFYTSYFFSSFFCFIIFQSFCSGAVFTVILRKTLIAF